MLDVSTSGKLSVDTFAGSLVLSNRLTSRLWHRGRVLETTTENRYVGVVYLIMRFGTFCSRNFKEVRNNHLA